jgi:hypothetical protein
MNRVVFASPAHANGGCIFTGPTEVIGVITTDRVIFANPRHANGGCIFADPTLIIVPIEGGGGGDEGQYRDILREDEEILAIIMAYTMQRTMR